MDISKLDALKNVPTSALSEIKPDKPTQEKPGSVEDDFNNTNKHTQDTTNTPLSTETIGKTGENAPIVSDTGTKKTSLGSVLKSKNAVSLIDMVIPSVICFVISKSGYYLEKKELQLSKDEREMVEPALQDALNTINLDMNNPWHVLGVVLGIVYGTKIMDSWDMIDKKQTKKVEPTTIEEIAQSSELTEGEKFEKEYNIILDATVKKRRKSKQDAREWIAKNESEKIKALMAKYNYTDTKYLNP